MGSDDDDDEQSVEARDDQGLETEAASLTEGSARALPMVADWTVRTDMLGEEGPSG